MNKLSSWLIRVGSVIFVLIFLIEGFLRQGYNPQSQFISELSIGPHGFIQAFNFIAFGIILLIFSFAVLRNINLIKISKIGPILFTVMGIGFILGGIFTTDPYTITSTFNNQTTHSLIHTLAGALVFLLMPVTCLVYYHGLRKNLNMRNFKNWTFVAAIILLLSFIGINLGRDVHVIAGFNIFEWKGVIQRIEFITFMAWIFIFTYIISKQEN